MALCHPSRRTGTGRVRVLELRPGEKRRVAAAAFVTVLAVPFLSLHNAKSSNAPATRAAAAIMPASDQVGDGAGLLAAAAATALVVADTTTVAPTTTIAPPAQQPLLQQQSTPATTRMTSAPTTARKAPATTAKPKAATTTVRRTTTTAAPKTTAAAPQATAAPDPSGNTEEGWATWHSYDNDDPRWGPRPCAHKTLPKGTVVTITYLKTGASTTCIVRDRGPYGPGGVIDLDPEIFSELTHTDVGKIKVRLTW